MGYDFYAYLDRMKYIKRWQLMRSTREENIMEHSQSVAVLAHALATIHNEIYGGSADVSKTVLYALYHETSEVMTGDLPTPIKYYNRSISGAERVRKADGNAAREAEKQHLSVCAGGRGKRGISTRKGSGQAFGVHQMLGGAAFGQQRICESQKEYRGRSAYPLYAGNRILFRKFHSLFFFDAGRAGRLLKRFFCFSLLKTRPTKREKGKACRKRAFAKIKKPNIHAFFKNS